MSVAPNENKNNLKDNFSLECNIKFVIFRCEDPESPNKVMFYLQEKPLMIEGCQVGLCDWEYLKNRFRRVLDECDPQRCYTRSESISNYGSMISLLITLSFILTY